MGKKGWHQKVHNREMKIVLNYLETIIEDTLFLKCFNECEALRRIDPTNIKRPTAIVSSPNIPKKRPSVTPRIMVGHIATLYIFELKNQ